MAEVPILQRVNQQIDFSAWYGYTENNLGIKRIGIESTETGYRVSTYPSNFGYVGVDIFVTAKDGIFGGASPSRVEVGPDYGGMVPYSENSLKDDNDGFTSITLHPTPKREQLFLPGDTGFAVFDELHTQIRRLGPLFEQTVRLVHPRIEADNVCYRDLTHESWVKDLKRETGGNIVGSLDLQLRTRDGRQSVSLSLDSTYADNAGYPEVTVFRSGRGKIRKGERNFTHRITNPTTLIAFSGLHREVQRLYR